VLVIRTDAGKLVPSVVSDDEAGMGLAVDHLIALGHRHLGHVAGPQDTSTGALRRAGFEAGLAQAGVPAQEIAVEAAPAYSREAGRVAALRLLERKPDLTAIVAANDLLALGVYDALAARGLNCPKDVSVVGHNDMPYVAMLSPPLTTVRIAQREMGDKAARLLLAKISDPEARHDHIVLAPELIARGSTASPRR
jgi:LacI family transcriptional regulator